MATRKKNAEGDVWPWILGLGAVGGLMWLSQPKTPPPPPPPAPIDPIYQSHQIPGTFPPGPSFIPPMTTPTSPIVQLPADFKVKYYEEQAVVTLTQVISEGMKGNPKVFLTPKPIANYRNSSIGTNYKKRVVLDSSENIKAFCDQVLLPAMLVFRSGNAAAEASAKESVIDWLNYNEFVLGDALIEQITDVFLSHGCRPAMERASWGDLTYPGIWSPIQDCHLQERDQMIRYFQGDPSERAMVRAYVREGVVARFSMNGLGFLVEYATARYIQLAFVAALDPKKAKSMIGGLINIVGASAKLGASILAAAAAGTASAVPIAGWIVAGVIIMVQVLGAILESQAKINAIRMMKDAISTRIDVMCQAYFGRGIKQLFPAWWSPDYRQQYPLLVDPHYPLDDTKDPAFLTFALTWSNQVKVVPQLPYHYHRINFDLPVALDVVTSDVMLIAPDPSVAEGQTAPFLSYFTKFLPIANIKDMRY